MLFLVPARPIELGSKMVAEGSPSVRLFSSQTKPRRFPGGAVQANGELITDRRPRLDSGALDRRGKRKKTRRMAAGKFAFRTAKRAGRHLRAWPQIALPIFGELTGQLRSRWMQNSNATAVPRMSAYRRLASCAPLGESARPRTHKSGTVNAAR